jgi:small GTP-binding protein
VVEYQGVAVSLNIFDVAGGEEYRTLVPLFARGSHVGVVVYDLERKETFDHVARWVTYLKANSAVRHIIIVGNKVDRPAVISAEDETELAATTASRAIRTSAHTGMGIDVLFAMIAENVTDDGDIAQTSAHQIQMVEKEKKDCNC